MRRWPKPRPASLIAGVALFVALGGTGDAISSLPKNSVGSKQTRTGQVKGSDLAKNAVTSGKVKDGSLLAGDFKSGQVPAGAQGPIGPKGDPGANGTAGAPGS